MKDPGARVYGLAAILMGVLGLLWRDFAVDWMPVPAALPGRTALAIAVAILLVAGGILINIERLARFGALVLTLVFALGLALLDLTRLATHLVQFDYWDGASEQLAIVAAGKMAYVMSAGMDEPLSERLLRAGRIVIGLCLFVFGAAHFVYLDATASLVPNWLPPKPMFWAVATGIAQIAAGLAFVSGVQALLAARLLAFMYFLFAILVHARLIAADPASHAKWIENADNLVLLGAALIVADSLASKRGGASRQTPD